MLSSTYLFLPFVHGDGENWLDGWTYRKTHVITQKANAGTNYQVNITAHYGSGSDTGNTVYLNSHSQPDFDDVRFTESDGSTLLDYWREAYYNGDNATFWVEISDDLTAGDSTIYLYYGNATVSSASSITTTFPISDDFDDGSFNTTTWNIIAGTPVESGGKLSVESDKLCSDNPLSTGAHKFGASVTFIDNDYSIQIGGKYDPYGSAIDYALFRRYSGGWVEDSREGGSGGTLNSWSVSTNVVYRIFYTWINDTRVNYYTNGSLDASDTSEVPNQAMYIFFSSVTNIPEFLVDWVFEAKYVDGEPAHGSWGVEETLVIFSYITLYYPAGGIVRIDNATVANGTKLAYVNNTVASFELVAVVEGNLTYGFDNYTWNGNYSYSNPYDFSLTIVRNMTLWVYFVDLEGSTGIIALIFIGVMVVAVACPLILWMAVKKRR
jgi:hypothetical protein